MNLVQLVAEKVMNWHVAKCESAYFDSYCDSEGIGQGPVAAWKPLTNWNHCMEVIDLMQKKGFEFTLMADMVEFSGQDATITLKYKTNPKHAILEAALRSIGYEST